MVVSQTPLRLSFVGGGTDFASFYGTHKGQVISATIDKYIYVIVKKRFDDLIVLHYTENEIVENIVDIKHDIIKAALQHVGIQKGIEIITLADITAKGSGLGSSSVLTVGLLNALYHFQGLQVSSEQIAKEACIIEIEMLQKPIGKQDQYIAAYGGIKKIELSSNTMNMDVQYIRNEDETDGTNAHASNVAASVSSAVSCVFGFKASAQVAGSVANSTLQTSSAHNIIGTLVITAACTHKMATELAPFILDPEKAISAWNKTFPKDPIPSDPRGISLLIDDNTNTNVLSLLSGKTIGSSFVGLVHFEQHENTNSSQTSNASTKAANAEFQYGGWFASYEGKFGVTKDVSDSVKNLFSNSNVTSHCALITMGLIPSIKSNLITTTVSKLQPDAKEVMDQLSAIQGATDSITTTQGSAASSAKAGSQFIELNNSYITNVVSNLGIIENNNNKVIDTNSLMTAFDDYVQQATKGEDGVPINFYLREITKSAIAKAWMKKFDPLQSWQFSSADDAETGVNKTA